MHDLSEQNRGSRELLFFDSDGLILNPDISLSAVYRDVKLLLISCSLIAVIKLLCMTNATQQ